MLLEVLLLLVSVVVYILYKLNQLKRKQDTHWQSKGVRCPPSEFPMGNLVVMSRDILLARVNNVDAARSQYDLMRDEPFYGAFLMSIPVLVINDPDLIKAVLVKDFDHFADRLGEGMKGMFNKGGTRGDQIWRRSLFNSAGEEWKNTRSTFSPIFTSGKLRSMMGFIHEVTQHLMRSLDEEAENKTEFDLREKFGKFSMDTIASCAFGVDARSFTDPDSVFVRHGRNIFRRTPADLAKFVLIMLPGGRWLMKQLDMGLFKPTETRFFDEVIRTTLRERRRRSDARRNDLIDMMLDAMNGLLDEDSDDEEEEDTRLSHKANKKDLDEITIVATALIMLVAGYDTTGQTLSYAVYELAMNQDIQRRLQDEIDEAMPNLDGKLPDYAAIQDMEYLDMVFHETLRLHTMVGNLQRACIEDYTLPGTDVKISKGDEIFINAAGIHADPKYYPEPEKFNPEHFSKEGRASRHPYAYLGFGQGPRSCIGMRFAVLESKIALVSLLSKYNVVKGPRTVERVELDPAAMLGASKDGLFVRVVPRR